jgi:hypothetical protein
MTGEFEDISVTRFDAQASDQDGEFPGLFHFKFFLSRSAPDLWVRIAEMEVAPNGRVSFVLQRRAAAFSGYIQVRCTPQEAQRIKDALNDSVLPGVNQLYRREAEAARRRAEAAAQQRKQVIDSVADAVRNQK